jgi:hypothetical protein
MISKYHNYGNCKICNEIRDSDYGYIDDPDTAAVQMYRHVPDCTDCKAMANLTSTHSQSRRDHHIAQIQYSHLI